MNQKDKTHHQSIEAKAHSMYSLSAAGQSDKLLQELNATNPKELSKLAAKLKEEANKTAGKGLPEIKITQQANTKEGGLQQPIQLSFESKTSKPERAQVFSYDVLKHKWYHSDLDQKARSIELYAFDGKPAKVIDILNTVKAKDFSELARKLNEQTNQFTIGSESFPAVEVSKHGIVEGGMQPTEFSLSNKSDYHVHVYQYDALKHKWNENTQLSGSKSLQRLGANWQFQLSETQRMFGKAGKDFANGADTCYRFFIKMEGVTKSLESLSGGEENLKKR